MAGHAYLDEDGKRVYDADGKQFICDVCPCGCPDNVELVVDIENHMCTACVIDGTSSRDNARITAGVLDGTVTIAKYSDTATECTYEWFPAGNEVAADKYTDTTCTTFDKEDSVGNWGWFVKYSKTTGKITSVTIGSGAGIFKWSGSADFGDTLNNSNTNCLLLSGGWLTYAVDGTVVVNRA